MQTAFRHLVAAESFYNYSRVTSTRKLSLIHPWQRASIIAFDLFRAIYGSEFGKSDTGANKC